MSIQLIHRPTRVTTPFPQPEPSTLAAPPVVTEDAGTVPMQFLLPVIGAFSSMVMMVVMRNGQPLFLVIAGLVFCVAVIGGLAFALSSRGRAAKEQRIHRELYLDYLEEERRRLASAAEDARYRTLELNPSPNALSNLARDPARLWERRRRDEDFLATRVGVANLPWFQISVPPSESPTQPSDPVLLAEAKLLIDTYSTVPQLPLTLDLRTNDSISIIGDREECINLVRAMILQLATHHPPDDLWLAAAYAPERVTDWRGFDLLPHVLDGSLFDGPVPARRVAPALDLLAQLLSDTVSERIQHASGTRRNRNVVPPHLIIFSDDHGEPAKELPFNTSGPLQELGITIIRMVADRLHEPDDVKARITLGEEATLTLNAGTPKAVTTTFAPDAASTGVFEAAARNLAALRLTRVAAREQTEERIPDIGELLGCEDPAQLDPELSWLPRAPEDFLRVPFGLDDVGAPVKLDLKESAQFGMGPHGICIGATGSGKSEMLRTLILSLAMSHPPEDLSMVLVDYKGGAAFAPFTQLPHLAGLIDNLADDPQLTTRARASVQGEVVRRQQLLKSADSSPSISHYRELREQNRPDLPPLPHLFLVIDEFGELLTAEPEFIDVLLQIGRIGRSIGVHLLLSSQRIEGGKLRGLDTYLSYRLGLRTFSEAESHVVLNTPDAFHLPALPGFGYLKVDTSVYARFRAGYVSGPTARPNQAPSNQTSVPLPMLLPAFNGVGKETAEAAIEPAKLTRINVGSTYLEEAVAAMVSEERRVRPVWLPPLPERLPLGSVLGSETPKATMQFPVGLEDDPAQQQQRPWILNLTKAGGHAVVIGAPSSGRSTTLRTVAVSLCLTHTPREVAIYGMDLTGGRLQRLEHFPHVGGVATRSSRDRLRRLLEEIGAMIALRERVFKERGIDSLAHLRRMHADGALPELSSADVVLLVDGFGSLRQDFEDLEELFTDIMLRAASFGIHLVLGLTRWNELRMAHQALFGTKIELRLNEPGDSIIDRKLSSTLGQIPGRVLLDSKLLAQVALPVLEDAEDGELGQRIEELAIRSSEAWSGPKAAPIRLLPLALPRTELPDQFEEPDIVPFGLRQDTMELAFWDFQGEDQHLIVLGDSKCGKSSLLRLLATGLMERFTSDELVFGVIDIRGHVPEGIPEAYMGGHAKDANQALALASEIARELARRPGLDAAARAKAPRVVLMVDDYDIVAAAGTNPLEPILPYLPSARDLDFHLIITRPVAGATRALYERALQVTRDTGGSMLLMSGERSEGQVAPRVYPERFPPGRGRYLRRGDRPHVVQVAVEKTAM